MPDPQPGPGQVLIEVRHTSLNAGELFVAGISETGTVLGFDASGVVAKAAADGTGPAVGTRVVSFAQGAGWAQLRAVDTNDVAIVPDSVDLAEAATFPVAAGTALRALWQAGPTLGMRVLVTGASGGVGTFAIQLAKLGGAHVIASVGNPDRARGLPELGADEVVVGLNDLNHPVDIIIDQVGGPQLVHAYTLLAPGGSVQSVGWSSGEPALLPVGSTLGHRHPISLTSVYNGEGLNDRAKQLQVLLDLLDAGRLKPTIGWHGSWNQVAEAAKALTSRTLTGKAILDID
ncbi:zinc-binding dehydrogenase [Catenulispora yoronensis]|uniref:zinc-binding dehydrogenase n=1 Tax=Catenulispora yoronensis TaxID=450799 RepID=UPI0031D161B3